MMERNLKNKFLKFTTIFVTIAMIFGTVQQPSSKSTVKAQSTDKLELTLKEGALPVNVYGNEIPKLEISPNQVGEENYVIKYSSQSASMNEVSLDTFKVFINGVKITNQENNINIDTVSNTITINKDWFDSENNIVAILWGQEVGVSEGDKIELDEHITVPTNKNIIINVTDTINSLDTRMIKYSLMEIDVTSPSEINWGNSLMIEKNGAYYVYGLDELGRIFKSDKIEITNIDKDAPVITGISQKPDAGYAQAIEVTVEVEKEEDGLMYAMDSQFENQWQAENVFILTDNEKHTFYVKDALGNISNGVVYNVVGGKIDLEQPIITEVTVEYDGKSIDIAEDCVSSTSKYTFNVVAEDMQSGILEYYATNGTEKFTSKNGKFSLNGGSYLFSVKDNVGNISAETEINLKVDNDKPEIIEIESSNSNPTNQPLTLTINANDVDSGIKLYGISNNDSGKEIEWQESNVFTIQDAKAYYFYVMDNATPANISESKFYQVTNYNTSKPVIESIVGTDDEYTNTEFTVSVTGQASTNEAGKEFEVVAYAMDSTEHWQESNVFTIQDALEHTFYAKDSSGNISDPISYQSKTYDMELPQLNEITFSQKNDNFLASALNFLSFGYFFNKEAIVTIDADDLATSTSVSSGINSYTLFFFDVNGQKADYHIELVEENGKLQNTATLDKDFLNNFQGTMSIRIEDKAGNVTETAIHSQNSNLLKLDQITDGQFMVENDAPELLISSPENGSIHSSNVNIEFSVNDKTNTNFSGIAGVEIDVNGSTVMESTYAQLANQINFDQYTLNIDPITHSVSVQSSSGNKNIPNIIQPTDQISNWNNGHISISITAYDNAGNASIKTIDDVYFDQTAPIINDFVFNVNDENGDMELLDAVQVTSYGFYFKQDINVTISAEDKLDSTESISSGVDTMHIYLEDNNNEKLYTVSTDGTLVEINSLSEVNSLKTDKQVTFVIPANFKGQIYAYATDKVGNMPINCVNNPNKTINEYGYVHPDGTIVENQENHQNTSSIEFVVPRFASTQNQAYSYKYTGNATPDKELAYENDQLVPLYSQDPVFGIKVTDTYSGIKKVEWTKYEGGVATKEYIEFDYNGKISGKTAGWRYSTDSNLVTTVENNELVVSGNYNNMVLLVELTDNAGNTTYDYYVFGVDKTAPQIDVTYDNNNGDAQSGDGTYFDADRHATITVMERNFRESDVVVEVTRDGQLVEVVKNWDYQEGSNNHDDNRYTMYIPYVVDGDYEFYIAYKDNAGHQAKIDYNESLAPTYFTIDKIAPVVQINYDNNAATNEYYFNTYRTATIVILEHNFDVNRVQFTQTASLNGQNIGVPNVSWNHNGDTHIATISYNADGDYTFDMIMNDKAGNKNSTISYGNSVATKMFTVDTTIEKPIISGISNGAAYRGEVVPTIEFNDVNFDSHQIRLTRTRLNEQNVDVTAEFIQNITLSSQGGTGSNDTFDVIQENDGIYTLYVQIIDLAGNEESETITFSVNRFGSVYVYNNALSNLVKEGGMYVQSVDEDLVVTEYNPNQLIEDSLILDITRDGNPIETIDATITPTINQYVTVGESGWYQYEYNMSKDNFNEDGIYRITVSSKDIAGNMPENTNYEDMNILFRVDDTKPELSSVIGLEKSIINKTSVEVQYNVYDSIGLKQIQVYVDGKVISKIGDFTTDMNNYNGTFTLNESSNAQNVRIQIEDMAGNITDTSSEDFTSVFVFNKNVVISTNFFVRWYANKPLFFGSIAVVVVLVGGLWFFIVKKRDKDTIVEE